VASTLYTPRADQTDPLSPQIEVQTDAVEQNRSIKLVRNLTSVFIPLG
jgi:hypothetical protein